jgi:hypothetical protein
MTILIYRNRLNGDIRRFSRISKGIASGITVTSVTINDDTKKNNFLSKIVDHDTIIIFSHGSYDQIYHRFNSGDATKIQTLLNVENMDYLIDKKVIAISCGTAKTLGLHSTLSGCKVFLGFKGKIHYGIQGQGRSPSNYYRQFLKDCYKYAFETVIQEAVQSNWTFGKLQKVLGITLNKQVTLKLKELRENRGERYIIKHKFDMAIIAVSKVVSNLTLHGNKNEVVG